jgi:hypothetical protein
MKSRLIIAIIIILVLSIIIAGRNILGNLLSGKVHSPDEYVGDVIKMKDGNNFTIFRRLQVKGNNENPDNLTVFQVRFKFRNLSNKANKSLSIIPAPFLIGMEDFREKFWAINENNNDFLGIYQWSSHKAAERYPETFIFKLMTKRAVPGSISYSIVPKTDVSEFITTKLIE